MNDTNAISAGCSAGHHPANPASEVFDPADCCPVRVHITQVGPHELEILTHDEWAALPAEDEPDEYFRYHADAYFRFRAEPPRI